MAHFITVGRHRRLFDLLVIVVAAILITLPIFLFGIPSGNDMPQHYQFAQTFYSSLQNGVLYPSWSDATNYGFGDVGVRFYPPLSYYVLCLFRWIAGNWYDGSVLTFCFWFFAGGTGLYLWAQEWFDRSASIGAAIVYIFAPYHANQIFNAFMYAEFAAASILPFCFFFLTRSCRTGKLSAYLGLSISCSALLLTHLPMAVIGFLALTAFALFTIPWRGSIRVVMKLALSVAFGLAASSFYWIKVVTELNFVGHITQEFTSSAYDFHKNFLAAFLYVSPDEYVDRSLWFGDLMLVFTLGLITSNALLYLLGKKEPKPKLWSITALLGLGLFLSTPLSLPIWERIELLQKVQFPWRWMAIITLAAAMFGAAGFDNLRNSLRSKMRPLVLLIAGFAAAWVLFTVMQVIRPALFIERGQFTFKIDSLSNAESCECWRPIWARKEALANIEKVTAKGRNVILENWSFPDRIFHVSAGKSEDARIATFYYPHWQLTINGQPVSLSKDEAGAILIPLPSEEADVRLFFCEPNIVRAAGYASAATWSIFATCLLILLFRYRDQYRIPLVPGMKSLI